MLQPVMPEPMIMMSASEGREGDWMVATVEDSGCCQ